MIKLFFSFDKSTRLFLISTGIMGFSNGLFDAVYNFYLASHGIDKIDTGKIYAIAMFMMSAAVIPLVIMSRKISTKKLLISSSIMYALPFLVLPFSSSILPSAIALGLILSGMIAILSTGNALFGSHVGENKRTTLFTFFFGFYLSACMAASFAVALITKLSPFKQQINYQGILLSSFICAGMMLLTRIYSVKNINDLNIKPENTIMDSKIEWRNFFIVFLAAFLLGGSITLIFRFANILFNQAYSLDISQISLVLGLDKIVSIIGAICAPLFVKKFDLKSTLLLIGSLTFILLFSQSRYLPLSIFIGFYFGRLLLNYALMPLLDTLTITGFDKNRVLISSSIRQLSFYLGSAFAAIIYGRLFQQNNWTLALIYSAIMALAGTIALSFVKEYQKNAH